jgi:hypothetical protein
MHSEKQTKIFIIPGLKAISCNDEVWETINSYQKAIPSSNFKKKKKLKKMLRIIHIKQPTNV